MESGLELAARVMLLLAGDAPPGSIKPLDYWSRVRSACESAASEADDYPGLLCAAGKRLGIEVLRKETGAALLALAPTDFEPLRSALVDRTLYVVVLAQSLRAAAREEEGDYLSAEEIAALTRGAA